MFHARLLVATLLAVALAGPAAAQPAEWTVGALPRGEGLNLRTGPGPGFEAIGQLAPGATPFSRETCVLLITDRAETDAGKLPEWCRLTRNGQVLGWVAARYLIPAEGALRIVRGWRDDNDACKLIGETALTGEFLDDAADLVGCPAGAPELAELWPLRARDLGQMLGWHLVSVPIPGR